MTLKRRTEGRVTRRKERERCKKRVHKNRTRLKGKKYALELC